MQRNLERKSVVPFIRRVVWRCCRQEDRGLLGPVEAYARRHEVPGQPGELRQGQHPGRLHEADPGQVCRQPGLRPG